MLHAPLLPTPAGRSGRPPPRTGSEATDTSDSIGVEGARRVRSRSRSAVKVLNVIFRPSKGHLHTLLDLSDYALSRTLTRGVSAVDWFSAGLTGSLSLVLFLSGIGKLARRNLSLPTQKAFGFVAITPSRLRLLGALETTVAATLLIPPALFLGLALATFLFACFSLVLVLWLSSGYSGDCGCNISPLSNSGVNAHRIALTVSLTVLGLLGVLLVTFHGEARPSLTQNLTFAAVALPILLALSAIERLRSLAGEFKAFYGR